MFLSAMNESMKIRPISPLFGGEFASIAHAQWPAWQEGPSPCRDAGCLSAAGRWSSTRSCSTARLCICSTRRCPTPGISASGCRKPRSEPVYASRRGPAACVLRLPVLLYAPRYFLGWLCAKSSSFPPHLPRRCLSVPHFRALRFLRRLLPLLVRRLLARLLLAGHTLVPTDRVCITPWC